MNNLFLFIYEVIARIYSPVFVALYNKMADEYIYGLFGWVHIIVPGLFWLFFYYVYRWPYRTVVHWRKYGTLVVFSTTLILAIVYYVKALRLGSEDFVNEFLSNLLLRAHGYSLIWKYSLVNLVLAVIISRLWCLLLHRWSKLHIHLPGKII